MGLRDRLKDAARKITGGREDKLKPFEGGAGQVTTVAEWRARQGPAPTPSTPARPEVAPPPPVVEAKPATPPPAPEAPRPAPVVEVKKLDPPKAGAAPAWPPPVAAMTPPPAADAPPPPSESRQDGFRVRVYNPDKKINAVFYADPGEYLLDAASRAGVELPSSCRNGGCFACAGRFTQGRGTMHDQYVMEQNRMDEGYVLLCCCSIEENVEILTHQEEAASV